MERKLRLIDFVYPRHCPVCDDVPRPLGTLICKEHKNVFTVIKGRVCKVCGKELKSEDAEDSICKDCISYRKNFIRNFALYNYDEMVAESIAHFKFMGRREYGEYYATRFLERYGRYLVKLGIELVVPVPIHKSKLKKRGFNQAAEIARYIAPPLDAVMREDIIVRDKETRSLKGLSPSDRAILLAEAMTVSPDIANYRRVLVVDDIYTTGATLDACALALTKVKNDIKVFTMTICIGKNS